MQMKVSLYTKNAHKYKYESISYNQPQNSLNNASYYCHNSRNKLIDDGINSINSYNRRAAKQQKQTTVDREQPLN